MARLRKQEAPQAWCSELELLQSQLLSAATAAAQIAPK